MLLRHPTRPSGYAETLVRLPLALICLIAGAFAVATVGDSLAAASQVTLRPAAGSAGTKVHISGRGFPYGRRVVVHAGRRRIRLHSRHRRFKTTTRIRARRVVSRVGRRRVVNRFRLERGRTRVSVGEVAAATGERVRWGPLAARAHTQIRLRGSGFRRRARLRISVGGRTTRVRATRRGRFAAAVKAPQRAGRRSLMVRSRRVSLRMKVRVRKPKRHRTGPFGPPGPGPLPGGEAVIAGAGDIAASNMAAAATARALDAINPALVYTLGDNAYPDGSAAGYAKYYAPTWGRFMPKTKPVPGNHEYMQPGAGPYFDYFGALAGVRGSGYYAYRAGSWRVYALNSNIPMKAGSPQETWLRGDLAAHPHKCVLAYWHHPRFTAGKYHDDSRSDGVWRALYGANAEIVLSGHDHNYQRYAPLSPTGVVEPGRGIREFVVGTGGAEHYELDPRDDGSREAQDQQAFGVLKLTLWNGGYRWDFVPAGGSTFTDSGAGACH
jgi:Calcineurin-like phosphoesterase